MEDRSRVVFVPDGPGNPYQDELAKGLEAQGVKVLKEEHLYDLFRFCLYPKSLPDILHLHWLPMVGLRPFNFIRALVFIFRVIVFRLCGVKVIWTAHNLIPHESAHPWADVIFRRIVGKLAGRVIVHGETAREELASKFGVARSRIVVVPHGSYIGAYKNSVGSIDAKKQLGINESQVVMLFLGHVRPYKGVLELIRDFKACGFDQSEACLIIAGRPLDEELAAVVFSEIDGAANIDFKPGFVAEDMMEVYLNAADVVVLPYKKILSSGAALLAMSFGKACVAPKIGCLNDVLSPDGAFFYSKDDSDGLRQALVAAFDNRSQLKKMGAVNLKKAESWSWSSIAKQTADVYQT